MESLDLAVFKLAALRIVDSVVSDGAGGSLSFVEAGCAVVVWAERGWRLLLRERSLGLEGKKCFVGWRILCVSISGVKNLLGSVSEYSWGGSSAFHVALNK